MGGTITFKPTDLQHSVVNEIHENDDEEEEEEYVHNKYMFDGD